jgi:hypothetical protein
VRRPAKRPSSDGGEGEGGYLSLAAHHLAGGAWDQQLGYCASPQPYGHGALGLGLGLGAQQQAQAYSCLSPGPGGKGGLRRAARVAPCGPGLYPQLCMLPPHLAAPCAKR